VAYWVSALVGIVTVGVVVFAVMTLASWLRRTGGRRPATTRQADPADA
jgi:hypothetical protein